MELLLLLLIVMAVGYFLGSSRFSERVDQAAGKVTQGSKDLAGRVGDWWGGLFGRRKEAGEEVVDAEFVAEPPSGTGKQPAAKRASRRKSDEAAEDDVELPEP